MRDKIIAASKKGFGVEAITRLLNVDITEVHAALDIVADSDKPAKPIVSNIDNDTLRDMARDTLASLIQDMQASPTAFKPSEIISACREALDRTEGKAAQSITIDAKQTITHEMVMSLPPEEAYRKLMDIDIIEMAGGDTAKGAAGCDVPKAPPLITGSFGG